MLGIITIVAIVGTIGIVISIVVTVISSDNAGGHPFSRSVTTE